MGDAGERERAKGVVVLKGGKGEGEGEKEEKRRRKKGRWGGSCWRL